MLQEILLCSFDPGTGSFLSFLVLPGSWFCRAREERGVLFIFGAIRASHTPQTPTNIARKRRESRLAERGKSAGLERASRSHILAGPTGACRCGPNHGRDHQKAEKRPQRSVLPAHSVRGIRGCSVLLCLRSDLAQLGCRSPAPPRPAVPAARLPAPGIRWRCQVSFQNVPGLAAPLQPLPPAVQLGCCTLEPQTRLRLEKC
ncbi:hypothetical protein NDU88_009124 [Pleurodeles waltl]|uniref:Uncharacterized protein n=1 Tax=Pleurodeles waltl TaxID=8319 RepID=A0AAV7RWP1_PLEWA|nr:hypothetical protein NDU88_009124 [Pleurodeles waltl]